MNELYKVKEMLVEELKEFGRKGELSKPALDSINKLAHAAKNVCKVIKFCEEEEYDYSNAFERSTDVNDSHSERIREELRRMIDNL